MELLRFKKTNVEDTTLKTHCGNKRQELMAGSVYFEKKINKNEIKSDVSLASNFIYQRRNIRIHLNVYKIKCGSTSWKTTQSQEKKNM